MPDIFLIARETTYCDHGTTSILFTFQEDHIPTEEGTISHASILLSICMSPISSPVCTPQQLTLLPTGNVVAEAPSSIVFRRRPIRVSGCIFGTVTLVNACSYLLACVFLEMIL
ncbi:hypothetical protein LXL04_038093 [Taraxacum kok-saghyz]